MMKGLCLCLVGVIVIPVLLNAQANRRTVTIGFTDGSAQTNALSFGSEIIKNIGYPLDNKKSIQIEYQNASNQTIVLNRENKDIVRIEYLITATKYKDAQGKEVVVPLGKKAFASKVYGFKVGNPKPLDYAANPDNALGEPNFNGDQDTGYVTLGCGGSIMLEFTNVYLVNVDGPDLYVFEIGMVVEPTFLEISKDGKEWLTIGEISGGEAKVDFGTLVKKEDRFRFIRLTDLKRNCKGDWPGADIDAVVAVGAIEMEKK